MIISVKFYSIIKGGNFYLDVDNPFEKEQFEDILNSNNTNLSNS